MALPVNSIDICIGNGITAVDHHGVACIDAHMGNTGGIIGADKEHQITGTGIASGNWCADVVEALCAQPSHIPTAVIQNPGYEAGTVKGCGRCGTLHR